MKSAASAYMTYRRPGEENDYDFSGPGDWGPQQSYMTYGIYDHILQNNPCKLREEGHPMYCDRYWEDKCGQTTLYDCPNGLVWIGRNQGILDGCDYPWKHPNICQNKERASKYVICILVCGYICLNSHSTILKLELFKFQ